MLIFPWFYMHFRDSRVDPGGVEDELKTENVEFPLVLKHFQLRENGETTEKQRRYNGGTTEKQRRNKPRHTRAAASCRGFSIGFSTIFSILIFEPLLEPLQYTTVREIRTQKEKTKSTQPPS